MLNIRIVEERRQWEAYYHVLTGADSVLPAFLEYGSYPVTAVALEEDSRFIGLILGVMPDYDSNFYLHYIRVLSGTSMKQIIFFIEEMASCLKEKYGRQRIIINMIQADDSEPVAGRIFSRVKTVEIEKISVFWELAIKTRDFDTIRKNRWYQPDRLAKKGYSPVRWEHISQKEKAAITEKEKSGDVPEGYLSPGLQDRDWNYDADSSFALKEDSTGEIIGWIMTERIGESGVKLRRFFIDQGKRHLLIGASFASWVLEYISEHYDMLFFDVEKGNRQMEISARRYFVPVVQYERYRVQLSAIIR